MDIAFVTCLHKRSWLSSLWYGHTVQFGSVHAACTIGDEDNANIAARHGSSIACENLPLGRKHNAALALAMQADWQAMMVCPSDDFVSPAYVEAATAAIAAGANYVFPMSCGLFDVATGQACVLRHEPRRGWLMFGAGRMLSRRAAEAIGPLWTDDKNKGLDTDSHVRILAHGFKPTFVDVEGVCLTDVKTDDNLWPYRTWAHRPGVRSSDADGVLGHVSDDVRQALLSARRA